jgi:hypothetical protein
VCGFNNVDLVAARDGVIVVYVPVYSFFVRQGLCLGWSIGRGHVRKRKSTPNWITLRKEYCSGAYIQALEGKSVMKGLVRGELFSSFPFKITRLKKLPYGFSVRFWER